MADDPIITITDVRRAGICVAGARGWFPKHGLDFRDFLKNGIAESKLAATNDGFAQIVIAHTRGNRSDGK